MTLKKEVIMKMDFVMGINDQVSIDSLDNFVSVEMQEVLMAVVINDG